MPVRSLIVDTIPCSFRYDAFLPGPHPSLDRHLDEIRSWHRSLAGPQPGGVSLNLVNFKVSRPIGNLGRAKVAIDSEWVYCIRTPGRRAWSSAGKCWQNMQQHQSIGGEMAVHP